MWDNSYPAHSGSIRVLVDSSAKRVAGSVCTRKRLIGLLVKTPPPGLAGGCCCDRFPDKAKGAAQLGVSEPSGDRQGEEANKLLPQRWVVILLTSAVAGLIVETAAGPEAGAMVALTVIGLLHIVMS